MFYSLFLAFMYLIADISVQGGSILFESSGEKAGWIS